MRERGGYGSRVLEHHFKTLSPAEAKAERTRVQALTTEQRMEFLRKLAEKYGPEIDKEKGKSSDAKEAEKGEKKRRKLAEGEVPATPGAAPKQ
jgi:predicted  nucleic acid-binding Zn-ribbon protein